MRKIETLTTRAEQHDKWNARDVAAAVAARLMSSAVSSELGARRFCAAHLRARVDSLARDLLSVRRALYQARARPFARVQLAVGGGGSDAHLRPFECDCDRSHGNGRRPNQNCAPSTPTRNLAAAPNESGGHVSGRVSRFASLLARARARAGSV